MSAMLLSAIEIRLSRVGKSITSEVPVIIEMTSAGR